MNFNEQSFLCHYGIKGMKWGIRRYQNKDGTYTNAGKERYWGPAEKRNSVQPQSGVSGGGNVNDKDVIELRNKTYEDIRKTGAYSDIFSYARQLKKLSDERRQNFGQANYATEAVFDKKVDKLIFNINEKLKVLDNTFEKETKKINMSDANFSPSKFMLSELSSYKDSSSALAFNNSTGRVERAENTKTRKPDSKKNALKHSQIINKYKDYVL